MEGPGITVHPDQLIDQRFLETIQIDRRDHSQVMLDLMLHGFAWHSTVFRSEGVLMERIDPHEIYPRPVLLIETGNEIWSHESTPYYGPPRRNAVTRAIATFAEPAELKALLPDLHDLVSIKTPPDGEASEWHIPPGRIPGTQNARAFAGRRGRGG